MSLLSKYKGPGDGKPLGTNERTVQIYNAVVSNIAAARASGLLKPGQELNAMGITAQILLESDNGRSELSSKYNNYGGIKADSNWKGPKVSLDGSNWRVFATPEEGLKSQIEFYINNPRYGKAGVFNAKTPREHLVAVQKAGYAQESNYVDAVMGVVNSIPGRIKKADPKKLAEYNLNAPKLGDLPKDDNPLAPAVVVPPAEVELPKMDTRFPTQLDLLNTQTMDLRTPTSFDPSTQQAMYGSEMYNTDTKEQTAQKEKEQKFLNSAVNFSAPKGWFGSGKSMFNNEKENGGSIHIKPENRGKFTASADNAGMGVQEYAHHVVNNPYASELQRKRAQFAINAAGWNHRNGGNLYAEGGQQENMAAAPGPPGNRGGGLGWYHNFGPLSLNQNNLGNVTGNNPGMDPGYKWGIGNDNLTHSRWNKPRLSAEGTIGGSYNNDFKTTQYDVPSVNTTNNSFETVTGTGDNPNQRVNLNLQGRLTSAPFGPNNKSRNFTAYTGAQAGYGYVPGLNAGLNAGLQYRSNFKDLGRGDTRLTGDLGLSAGWKQNSNYRAPENIASTPDSLRDHLGASANVGLGLEHQFRNANLSANVSNNFNLGNTRDNAGLFNPSGNVSLKVPVESLGKMASNLPGKVGNFFDKRQRFLNDDAPEDVEGPSQEYDETGTTPFGSNKRNGGNLGRQFAYGGETEGEDPGTTGAINPYNLRSTLLNTDTSAFAPAPAPKYRGGEQGYTYPNQLTLGVTPFSLNESGLIGKGAQRPGFNPYAEVNLGTSDISDMGARKLNPKAVRFPLEAYAQIPLNKNYETTNWGYAPTTPEWGVDQNMLNLIHGYPNQAAAEADYGHVPIQNVMDFTGTSYDNLQTKDFNKYFANKELGSIQETPNTRPQMNVGIRGAAEGVAGINQHRGAGPRLIARANYGVGYGYQPGFNAEIGAGLSYAAGARFYDKLYPRNKFFDKKSNRLTFNAQGFGLGTQSGQSYINPEDIANYKTSLQNTVNTGINNPNAFNPMAGNLDSKPNFKDLMGNLALQGQGNISAKWEHQFKNGKLEALVGNRPNTSKSGATSTNSGYDLWNPYGHVSFKMPIGRKINNALSDVNLPTINMPTITIPRIGGGGKFDFERTGGGGKEAFSEEEAKNLENATTLEGAPYHGASGARGDKKSFVLGEPVEENSRSYNWTPQQIEEEEALQEETDPEGKYRSGGSLNNPGFKALPSHVQNKIISNMNYRNSFAAGGNMSQLTEFNSGGTHEENPLGGIPQGMGPNGNPNLVEQGETKLNAENYIFSDNLKLDKATAEKFNLPKGVIGRTFSDVSKKLTRPNSRREGDTIEQLAISKDLDNLMKAQEGFKEAKIQEKLAEISSLDPNALGKIMSSMQPQGAPQGPPQGMEGQAPQGGPSPEEQAMMEQQAMMQQQQGGMPQGGGQQMDPAMMEQMMMEQQMGQQQMARYGGYANPYGYGGNMMYANGGNMFSTGGDIAHGVGIGLQAIAPVVAKVPGYGTIIAAGMGGIGAGLENVGTGADFKEIARDVAFGMGKGAASTIPGLGAAVGMAEGIANKKIKDSSEIYQERHPGDTGANLSGLGGLTSGIAKAAAAGPSGYMQQLPGIISSAGTLVGNNVKDKELGSKISTGSSMLGKATSLIPGKSNTPNPNPNATIPQQGIQDTIFPGDPNDLNMPVGNYSEYGGYLGQGMNYNNGGMFDNGGRLTLGQKTYTSYEELMKDVADKKITGYSLEEIKEMWDNAVALSNPDAVDVGRTDGPMTEEEARNSSLMPDGPTVMPGNDNYTDNSSNSGSDFRFYNNPGMRAKAKRENFDVNTDLDNIDQDLSIAQTPGNLMANLLPVAYNAYMASKKPKKVKLQDFYKALSPVRFDYTQARSGAKESGAALLNSLRNSSGGGGAYMSNMLAANTATNDALAKINTAEENAYKQSLDAANKFNVANEMAAMEKTKKYNWGIEAARQAHMQEVATQLKDYSNKVLADQLAMSYAKMGAKDINEHLKVGYNPFKLNWFNNKQPELDENGNVIKK